jgi:DNA-directed RNA polymerase subunit beta'
VNKELKKKEVTQLVGDCYHRLGNAETVKFLDDLKDIGFRYASLSGLSIGIDDMKTPSSKRELIEQARRQVFEVDQQYQDGVITNGERYNKVVDIWARDRGDRRRMFRELSGRLRREFNPIFLDGGLRRPRLEAADPAAGRYARAHGDVRRDHRA